ncbi:Ribonucleases P/MRP protein subunit POP1 [Mesorhizobium escarrei]|uniref:Ribonucleases P/MRP protein subunit POP1 n=1 Tax=Mesorhizobium escarrei TaxID=666018 RepID=A0ABM9E9H8_9HYPH|nr:Ribonucleases P/MRP protein subunit POP1 [Mesorhizobium escarrei]
MHQRESRRRAGRRPARRLVDTKKKELVGNFKNGGTDYRPQRDPQRVKLHDFEDKTLGKVAPYGVYDVAANEGWVSVGVTADAAELAVQSIRTWRERMGRGRYPSAHELRSRPTAADRTGCACGCGSASSRRSPTRAGSRSASITIRRARRNGTE